MQPAAESAANPEALAALRTLVLELDREPLAHARALRAAREDLAADPVLGGEVDRQELEFLERMAGRRDADAALREAVGAARRSGMDLERRALLQWAGEDPAALFDLAELLARCRVNGMAAEANGLVLELDQRCARVPIDPTLLEEARERYAVLVNDEETQPIALRAALLRETAALLRRLAAREGGGPLGRLARRLERRGDDRVLAQRLEGLLGRRGVVALETTSLLLLVGVLVLLAVEATVALTPRQATILRWTDASICLLFIAEFCFKLSLAPHRASWFARNALVDLLPAIPAALLFVEIPLAGAEDAAAVRLLRLLRIAWFARYVQALRPALSLVRFTVFLLRGMDGVVRRFAPLLNRSLLFFAAEERSEREPLAAHQKLLFQALRREHRLLEEAPRAGVHQEVLARAQGLVARLRAAPVPRRRSHSAVLQREIPVEQAIAQLHDLAPEELVLFLSRRDLLAIDRVARVLNAVPVRWLPLVRRLAGTRRATSSERRVAELGRRVAQELERWRARWLFLADLHGIVTGPQILDRIGSAMVAASKRPAVRLLFFGLLFMLVRALLGEDSAFGEFLKRFVATPLVVLGAVCLVLLLLGRWLRALAGEATESLKRTSEAHFLNLLDLVKLRHEGADLEFLSARVFGDAPAGTEPRAWLQRAVREVRDGVLDPRLDAPPEWRAEAHRVAMLYLHFLDGGVLHESDIKTTEQLLANLSLENVRREHLRMTRGARRRLRSLSLREGSVLRGPYLWFQFITESIALETAKLLLDYNRHCLSLRQRAHATPERAAAFAAWQERRRAQAFGRTGPQASTPWDEGVYVTTEFHALDFLNDDPAREARIRANYGDEIAALLRADRQRMVREIFGMRPYDRLPRSQRSLNLYALYMARLSNGRVLLLPVLVWWWALRGLGRLVRKVVDIARELMAKELATRRELSGRASFAVARRKIARMKAPGALELVRLRVAFDPAYCGVPASWSRGEGQREPVELERDLAFLEASEPVRAECRAAARANRRLVERWHQIARELPPMDAGEDAVARSFGEQAVTVAHMTDRMGLRTLFHAEERMAEILWRYADPDLRVTAPWVLRVADRWARGGIEPVDQWLTRTGLMRTVTAHARRNLRCAYLARRDGVRELVDAWLALPDKRAPRQHALQLAGRFHAECQEVVRELTAVRAVHSLALLDLRNYHDLVFRLGAYAEDGEDPRAAAALP